ncbi:MULTISPECIES: hypothetical protein [Streptococcus]|jgi:hypothetical protein|uniref:DUF4230 domain-containing protein n=1 Tax=Streptococcus sanguinis TaxID=1305 RepID=A0A3P1S015_STRSA|nr:MULTISPECIES: hypothetical protein [Streptococcus]EJO21498.1 PF14014 family protein [Streptococcus sp. AS14]MBF1703064.1 DUF4230 domain-containing protein [Streptococcus sanguinis]MBF1722151.1 DUF4230 domain-containing protein [Streptococcus sp.]MCY7038128.1 DUF4230 domain-containing protein [Streptococcus sanguinis]RRC90167.1 DUF4230 domain-containing protein [Streptococcus sanguinis]
MKIVKDFIKKVLGAKIYIWIVVAVLAIFFVVAKTYNIIGFFQGKNASDERSQIYTQITRLEKVNESVFLDVGIQKVETIEKDKKIPGTNISIPLSVKKAIIILNYTAKFGIKEGIKIKKIAEHEYELTIPKYEVIGVEVSDNPKDRYKLYDMSGQLLSGSTENIDTGEHVAKSLSNKEQEDYIKQYKNLITESAEDYYTNIVTSIDSEAKVTFKNMNK